MPHCYIVPRMHNGLELKAPLEMISVHDTVIKKGRLYRFESPNYNQRSLSKVITYSYYNDCSLTPVLQAQINV